MRVGHRVDNSSRGIFCFILNGMGADFRLAIRMLAKRPVFTTSVIGLVALGLAINTLVFSLANAVFFRPLPVREPERLVRLVTVRAPLGPRSTFYYEEYESWKREVSAFSDLIAWSEQDMFLATGETTERARAHFVTGNFFSALGTQPAAGRLLTPADQDARAGVPPAVLSHPYWLRRFGGDKSVLGAAMALDRHRVQIVGVTPEGFNGISLETSPDIRLPVGWLRTLQPNLFENRIVCEVAGRLKPGVGMEAVRRHAESVWRVSWQKENPSDPGLPGRFELEPAARGISRLRPQFGAVLGLVLSGVLLLMTLISANVAGLTLTGLAGRRV